MKLIFFHLLQDWKLYSDSIVGARDSLIHSLNYQTIRPNLDELTNVWHVEQNQCLYDVKMVGLFTLTTFGDIITMKMMQICCREEWRTWRTHLFLDTHLLYAVIYFFYRIWMKIVAFQPNNKKYIRRKLTKKKILWQLFLVD